MLKILHAAAKYLIVLSFELLKMEAMYPALKFVPRNAKAFRQGGPDSLMLQKVLDDNLIAYLITLEPVLASKPLPALTASVRCLAGEISRDLLPVFSIARLLQYIVLILGPVNWLAVTASTAAAVFKVGGLHRSRTKQQAIALAGPVS